MTRRVHWTLALVLAATSACTARPEQAHRRYVDSGDRFVRDGRDAAAVIEYRNAIRHAPDDDAVYRRLGAALARLGRGAEAARAFEMAEGRADGRLLPADEAALRTVVDANPSHVGARLALAERLIARQALVDAESQLLAALAQDPAREVTNRALAALYLSAGRLREAEERFRAAAAATPQRLRSRLALADFLIAQARWPDVRTALDDAATDPALGAPVAVRRVAVADATGSHAEARRDLARLLTTSPTVEAWTLDATFAYADGNLQRATAAAKQGLALDPEFPAAQALLERIRWHQLHSHPPARRSARTSASSR